MPAERSTVMVNSVNDSDHDGGFVKIIAPAMHDTVYDDPVARPQSNLGVLQYEYGFSGDLHEAVYRRRRMHR